MLERGKDARGTWVSAGVSSQTGAQLWALLVLKLEVEEGKELTRS